MENAPRRWQPEPRSQATKWLLRVAVLAAAEIVTLIVLDQLMSTVRIGGLWSAVAAVAVITVLLASLWPLMVRITVRLMLVTVGVVSLLLAGALVWLAAEIVPGFNVATWRSGVVVSLVLSVVSTVLGSWLSINDTAAWQRLIVRRAIGKRPRIETTDVPGVLFIQIDGLACDVLREAIDAGVVPTIADMLGGGTHRLVDWECDLSSQTGAMQAGIMFGNNHDMPAFRWYEKESGRIMVSNHPRNAAEIERRQSNGHGLLVGGVSRGNVFSGDANDALYTFSRLGDSGDTRHGLIALFANPNGLVRIFGMMIADIWRERRSYRVARREQAVPMGHRGGIYPLLRAGVTVGLAELTSATLAGDVHRGVPVAYVDYVGYDEVAHHSGIRRPESFDALRRIDERIRHIALGFDDAPRPYDVVILSDHGQSQGRTFLQRFGVSLREVVEGLSHDGTVLAPATVTEGWGNVSGVLTDVANDESFIGRATRRLLANQIEDGEVSVGPDSFDDVERAAQASDDNIIVLASGNLGLVSFTEIEGRATLADIEERHPGMVAGLASHRGIGFVMVRVDDEDAGVVFGRHGVHHLSDGRIEGDDPLEPFGLNAARHLARTDRFSNCPDIIINGFFDSATGDGNAFEELVGYHGGLGGTQCRPFIVAPTSMRLPDEPIVGAETVHRVFTEWMTSEQTGHGSTSRVG